MKLKEVGAMPKVSQHGVSFDNSKQDKFIYLNATVDLLQALDYTPSERKKHFYNTNKNAYSSDELLSILNKFCDNLSSEIDTSTEKANQLVKKLQARVNENTQITKDDKTAWLNNIKIMENYYLQYIINESSYKSALNALAKKVNDSKIEEVSFPMFRHYGFVLNDLISVLESQKPPIDADLSIETKDDKIIGTLNIKHQVKLSI